MWQVYGYIAIAIIWILIGRWKNRRLRKFHHELNRDIKSLPIVGHVDLVFGNDEERMRVLQTIGTEATKQGGIGAGWVMNRLYVMVSDPAIAELFLKRCVERDDTAKLARLATGNGTLFAPAAIWHRRRKILMLNFRTVKLNQFMEVFSRQSCIMAEQMQKAVQVGPVSVWKYLTTYSMDSVCETTLGVQTNAQKDPDQPFLRALDVYHRLLAERMFKPWLYSDAVYKLVSAYRKFKTAADYMSAFIDKVVKSKRKEIEAGKKENTHSDNNGVQNGIIKHLSMKPLLDLLIETSGEEDGYSDQDLVDESMVVLMAGTETIAVGTSFTMVLLSRHQDVQRKVYEELEEVFGGSSRPVEREDLPQLKYIDAVVRETLRLYPPLPAVGRKVTSDLTLPSGITVPRECEVIINIWALHRNPQYWGEDADRFRPERFLDTALLHPAQFMPFSWGPRNCIGYQYAMMSMKTALATLLRRYRVLPAPDPDTVQSPPHKDEPLRVKFNLTMKDVGNFMVQLESRL